MQQICAQRCKRPLASISFSRKFYSAFFASPCVCPAKTKEGKNVQTINAWKKIPADIYSQNTDLNGNGTMASAGCNERARELERAMYTKSLMFERTPAYNSRRPHKYFHWLKSTQPTVSRKSQVCIRSLRLQFDSFVCTFLFFFFLLAVLRVRLK